MRVLLLAGLFGAVATAALAQSFVVTKINPPAVPDKAYDEVHVSKAAVAGQEIIVWGALILNPDCTQEGTMVTQVLQEPGHGKTRVSDDMMFSNYPAGNVRAACNSKKSPGREVFYKSDPDFHGHDLLVVQNSSSFGRVRKSIIDIDVR